MARLKGMHRRAGGAAVRWVADYEVVGNVVHFRASFDGGDNHEGEFDFDPAHLDAEAAVQAFMRDHVEKSDRDVAP